MTSLNVAKSVNVWVDSVEKLRQVDLHDNVPNIQFPSLAVEMEAGIPCPNRFLDASAYNSKFSPELDMVAYLDSLAIRGEQFVCMLYSFRSISKAIPMLVSTAI